MSLENVLTKFRFRLQQLEEAIIKSEALYTEKEKELKKHLDHHNALIGACTEAENIIKTLELENNINCKPIEHN